MDRGKAHLAVIALGSNLGDRRGHLEAALAAMDALPGARVVARSSFHETDPVGPPGQGAYLNSAAILSTGLEPLELMRALLEIERGRGRVREPGSRWGPRTLDLDLLLYDDEVIHLPGLDVPHPRMHERRFVLAPLAEIGPSLQVPGRGTVAELLRAVGPGREL